MAKIVNLTIDGIPVQAPEGTLVVDAAKMAGIDIPVFCYHPKMEPVGMCRMCLVEIGRPMRDRATGQPVLNEDGSPKMQFGPKLETSCTTPVSEGMVVLNTSEKVKHGREDIIEFLLTSHPLDCPICDKGGECPLQNLTMGFGPGVSRFNWDEKMHLAKKVPLGNLIVLDRERCIQCGRCVRFQNEIVDDPVIAFQHRGRAMEIVSTSEPGFDSYFSGNTTDICPVGALTTTDFRFRARPWEIKSAASICTQCPVGCNLTVNVRREREVGGRWNHKRMMPRQNEWVNEIWICDKGRFGYHYAEREARITQAMIRRNGELVPASLEEALDLVVQRFKAAGSDLLTLASGRLSNEDLFNLRQVTEELGGKYALYGRMAGGDVTAQIGFTPGTNFGNMGPETAILIVASDLEEEAPIWWLRVKQAARRGAKLIVVNPRITKTDSSATHIVRYPYGAEAAAILAMVNQLSAKRPDLPGLAVDLARSPELQQAAQAFAQAENGVIIYGSEGLDLAGSQALVQACANLLLTTNHTGRPNNGLLAAWQRANEQGAWDMGFRPRADLKEAMQQAKALYIVGADPAGDDLGLAESSDFLVVQDIALTATAKLADVVLPVQSFLEREGSFTNGERRVQRFYPAVPEPAGVFADYQVTGEIGKRLGFEMESRSASRVMQRIAQAIPFYSGITYLKLAEVTEQWPIVGRSDLYYGGTGYDNHQGLGVQLPLAAGSPALGWVEPGQAIQQSANGLLAVPITRLYDKGNTLLPSILLQERIGEPYVVMSPADGVRLNLDHGSKAQITLNGTDALVTVHLEEDAPQSIVLVPRSFGILLESPAPIQIKSVTPTLA